MTEQREFVIPDKKEQLLEQGGDNKIWVQFI